MQIDYNDDYSTDDGNFYSQISANLDAGTYYVQVSAYGAVDDYSLSFEVGSGPVPPTPIFENAVNLGTDTAIANVSGASLAGDGEIDCYSFTLTRSANVTVTTSGADNGDTVMYLYNENYVQIDYNDDYSTDDGNFYSQISANLDAGTYYVQVSAYGAVDDYSLSFEVGSGPVPPTPIATGPEVILTITDPNHDYYGAMGGWKVQNDQTVAWQDLTTLGEGYAYLGLGCFSAGKAMPDIYVYNADASYIAAYTTDDTGAITGFETAFLGSGTLGQVGLADFNADGVSDLLLRTADGFVGYYANGAFSEVQGLGLEWTVAALGDVDGNGCADVVIAHEAGYVGAYLIGNDGSISWADLGNLDSSTAIVGAGDVNGDGTDDVIVQVGSNYYGAWLCGNGSVTGFFGIGTFDAAVQDIADYSGDGTDDLLLRTAGGVVGAALISGADATTWAEYGALGDEWSTKGVGIL